jgi:hypothetical protein
MRSAPSRFQTVERAIVAAILGLILQGAGRIRCDRAVPKKRWMSLRILGRECEGLLIRFQELCQCLISSWWARKHPNLGPAD